MHIRFCNRLFERIKVDDDKIDRRDIVFLQLFSMFGIIQHGKQTGMDNGVQSFYPSVENFGESGNLGDLPCRNTVFLKQGMRTACRNNLYTALMERRSEFDDTMFIGDTDEGA